MPPPHGQHPRFHIRTGSRAALRTASPAVEIIARRLLSKGKSIVPPELLSRSQKKKRDSGGRAGILSPSGVPKRNIEDSIKKLSKVAGRIGYYTIKQESGESYESLQVRWSNFRKTVKTCASIEDLCERLLGIATRIDERFLRSQWKNESKDQWMTSCRNAKTNPDIQACLREFENDGIYWEKVEYVHELMDISNQIPTSQVKNTDPKFWFEEFPSKLRDTAGPQDMAKHLKEICMQLRPGADIVDKEWVQEKRSEWLRRCAVCDNWPEFRQLMTSFDEDAVDWKNASKIMRRENESKDMKEESKLENSKTAQSSKSRKSNEEVASADNSNDKKEKRKNARSKTRPTKQAETNDSGEDQSSSEVEVNGQDGQDLTEKVLERKVKSSVQKKRSKNIDDSEQAGQRKKAKKIASVADDDKLIRSAAKDLSCDENACEDYPSVRSNPPAVPPLPTEESAQDSQAGTSSLTAGSAAASSRVAEGASNSLGSNPALAQSGVVGHSGPGTASAEASAVTTAICGDPINSTGVVAEAIKKPKIPRQRSRLIVSKAKPAKIASAVQPRTGLGEQFDQDIGLNTRNSQEGQDRVMGQAIGSSLPNSQANASIVGQNTARGVWDGAGHVGLALRNEICNVGNVGGSHYVPSPAMHHCGGGQGMGGMRPMAEGGLGQLAGLSGDGSGLNQRGGSAAGYMDALELGMDAQGFRSAGPGMVGHAAALNSGMLLQGVGMQAAAQGQGNGRGFQNLGLGLGMQQQGNRVGFGVQQELYSMNSLGDHAGAYAWGGPNWAYIGQAAANMRMMQPYEDAASAANMRMLQQLHSTSLANGLADGRGLGPSGAALAGLGLAGSGGGGGGPSFPTPAYPIPKYPQPRQDAFSAFHGPGSKQSVTAVGRPMDSWPNQVAQGAAAFPASGTHMISAAAGPVAGAGRRSTGRGGGVGGYETESDSDKEAEDDGGQPAAGAGVSGEAVSKSCDGAGVSPEKSSVQGPGIAAVTAEASEVAQAQADGRGHACQVSLASETRARDGSLVAVEARARDGSLVAVEARAYPVDGSQAVEEAVGLVQAYAVRVEDERLDDVRAESGGEPGLTRSHTVLPNRESGGRGAACASSGNHDGGPSNGGPDSCSTGGLDAWAQNSAEAVERVRGQEVALRNEYTRFLEYWRCVKRPSDVPETSNKCINAWVHLLLNAVSAMFAIGTICDTFTNHAQAWCIGGTLDGAA